MKTRRPEHLDLDTKEKTNAEASVVDTIGEDDTHRFCRTIDLTTREDKYDWISVKTEKIPHIVRANEKFCSVKMIEECVLKKHFSEIHPEIYCCTDVLRYNLTHIESSLFNRINIKEKLVDPYNGEADQMIRIDDVEQLIEFYDFCVDKVKNGNRVTHDSICGFVNIECFGPVPFTVAYGKMYIPIYYFSAICNHVKTITLSPEEWPMAYLKFCSRLLGYKKESLKRYSRTLIDFDDLKRILPANTVYKNCWPKDIGL